jgi:acylphosphatase
VKRVVLVITGRVQGVFYRASARSEAERQGLTGWVRNRDDGAVEAVAEGSEAALQAFIAWCRRGPPAARVDRIEESWAEATGEHRGYSVRR